MMFILNFLCANDILPDYKSFSFSNIYRTGASHNWMNKLIRSHEAFLSQSIEMIESVFSCRPLESREAFDPLNLHFDNSRLPILDWNRLIRDLKKCHYKIFKEFLSTLRLMQSLNYEKGVIAFKGNIKNIDQALTGAFNDTLIPITRIELNKSQVYFEKEENQALTLNIWGQDSVAECALFCPQEFTILFSTRALWQTFENQLHPTTIVSTFLDAHPIYFNFQRDWEEKENQIIQVPHLRKHHSHCILQNTDPFTQYQTYEYESLGNIRRTLKVMPRHNRGWREAMIMFSLKPCPFLMRAQEMIYDPLFIGIDMIKYPKTLEMIHQNLSPDQVLLMTLQLLVAFDHLKSEGIIHQNINPRNIYYTEAGRFILGDFEWAAAYGEAAHFPGEKISYTTAPEILGNTYGYICNTGADMFSLGVILYSILNHHYPFREFDMRGRLQFVPHPHYKSSHEPFAWFHNLVLDMMHGDYRNRPTVQDCMDRIKANCPRAINHITALCTELQYVSRSLESIQSPSSRTASSSSEHGLSSEEN